MEHPIKRLLLLLWAIDSEPIRARGIFVKYCIKVNKTVLKWLTQISSSYGIRFMYILTE